MPQEFTELTCETCKRVFSKPASVVHKEAKRGRGIRFCCRACVDQWKRETYPRAEMITLSCAHCGTAVIRRLRDVKGAVKRGRQSVFCTESCNVAFKRLSSRGGTAIEYLNCAECHKRFVKPAYYSRSIVKRFGTDAKIFCSRECSYKAQTGIDRGRSWSYFTCEICGNQFRRETTQVVNNARYGKPTRYCSRKCQSHQSVTSNRGFRSDLGHMVRSTWEANVCRVLNAMGIPYEYEPRAFTVESGVYIPDLLVAGTYWIEVKGYMRPKSQAKIDDFRNQFPHETIEVVGKPLYRQLEREWRQRIPEWEYDDNRRKRAA